MDDQTRAALERLLEVADRDTGQSRRCADFLLAWWNADTCGGFDLTDLWGLDTDLREDIRTVFAFISRNQHYPDTLGFERRFNRLVRGWRRHLVEADDSQAR